MAGSTYGVKADFIICHLTFASESFPDPCELTAQKLAQIPCQDEGHGQIARYPFLNSIQQRMQWKTLFYLKVRQ
jgi:hypothetical protein